MLEAQSRPKPCPFLLIDQVFTFTPGARRIWSTRVRSWQTHTKTNTTLEKGLCLERKYICNQLNLPPPNCHSVFIFSFSTIFFLMQIFLFSFQNSITYFNLNHTTSKKPYLLLIETRLTRCYQNCCFFHETLLKCAWIIDKVTHLKIKRM